MESILCLRRFRLLILSAGLFCVGVLTVTRGAETGDTSGISSAPLRVFPGKTWSVGSPELLGLNADILDDLAAKLGGRGCVIRHGYVVKSWGDQAEVADWFSSAKPVLSTALFFAVHEGLVTSVDQPVSDFGWELSEKDRAMTFRHLGAMTSGYARPESPGVAWAYNDFAIQLYQKTLFDRVFKQDAKTVLEDPKRLGALMFEDGLMFNGKNRLSASVRDFARIVWFWNCRGYWDGRPILPERYFAEFMQPQVPPELPQTVMAETDDYLAIKSYGGGSDHFARCGPGIYGFNWWFNGVGRQHPDRLTWPDAPRDTVMSIGARGNNAAMIHSLGLVLVCASGDWSDLNAGDPESKINRGLKLLTSAVLSEESRSTADSGHEKAATEPDPAAATLHPLQIRKWQPVEFSFQGPAVSEQGTPNPFTDFRLDVTFRSAKTTVVVPGYFAADGAAAETSAETGSVWRVHFLPIEEGKWTYRVSFRQGPNIAVSEITDDGVPVAPDGMTGAFTVDAVDPDAPGFLAQGQLRYVGERYLRFAETGKPFLKSGIDSPENLLAYADFDQTIPTHRYDPHAADAKPDDPSWQGGKGKNLFGLLNYLQAQKVNSVYFLTMNVQGDGKDVWPWTSKDERVRFDCSKLDQWEIVFRQMDRLGLMLHLVQQETENDQLLDEGELGLQRRLYYRELIARFSHHPALVWNLGEENTNTTEQQLAFAEYLKQHDPWQHPRVIHTYPSQLEKVYRPLLGSTLLHGPSFQFGKADRTNQETVKWLSEAEASGHKWFACLDEIGPADTCLPPDIQDPEHPHEVREALWGHLMAGGSGVEWIVAYDTWPRVKAKHQDIACENWRPWENMLRLTHIAVQFFHDHLPFAEMKSADTLVDPETGWCFAKPGETYVVYQFGGKRASIDLEAGEYSVHWFSPWTGGDLVPGQSVKGPGRQFRGDPPFSPEKDWVVLLRKQP
jgi:CubicO group peptidase (beta-lactamase class C family)